MPSTTPEQNQDRSLQENPKDEEKKSLRNRWNKVFWGVMLGAGLATAGSGCADELYIPEHLSYVDRKGNPPTSITTAAPEPTTPTAAHTPKSEAIIREPEIIILQREGSKVLVKIQANQTIYSVLAELGFDNPNSQYQRVEQLNPALEDINTYKAGDEIWLPTP